MRGLRVVMTPEADVFHDYEYARNPTKNYYMERNRLVFISSAYSLRLISVLAPVLVVAEAGLTALSWRQGWLGDKVAAWRWCVRHRSWMRKHRRELQQQRLVPDRALAHYLTPVIDPTMIDVTGSGAGGESGAPCVLGSGSSSALRSRADWQYQWDDASARERNVAARKLPLGLKATEDEHPTQCRPPSHAQCRAQSKWSRDGCRGARFEARRRHPAGHEPCCALSASARCKWMRRQARSGS